MARDKRAYLVRSRQRARVRRVRERERECRTVVTAEQLAGVGMSGAEWLALRERVRREAQS